MQGKLFHRCTHLLYCSVLSLGGNVNTRRMSQPDMGSIFHIKNQWKIQCFYPPRILNEHWCIYSCLQISTRENWFQYVSRVYATEIKFLCIITLIIFDIFSFIIIYCTFRKYFGNFEKLLSFPDSWFYQHLFNKM